MKPRKKFNEIVQKSGSWYCDELGNLLTKDLGKVVDRYKETEFSQLSVKQKLHYILKNSGNFFYDGLGDIFNEDLGSILNRYKENEFSELPTRLKLHYIIKNSGNFFYDGLGDILTLDLNKKYREIKQSDLWNIPKGLLEVCIDSTARRRISYLAGPDPRESGAYSGDLFLIGSDAKNNTPALNYSEHIARARKSWHLSHTALHLQDAMDIYEQRIAVAEKLVGKVLLGEMEVSCPLEEIVDDLDQLKEGKKEQKRICREILTEKILVQAGSFRTKKNELISKNSYGLLDRLTILEKEYGKFINRFDINMQEIRDQLIVKKSASYMEQFQKNIDDLTTICDSNDEMDLSLIPENTERFIATILANERLEAHEMQDLQDLASPAFYKNHPKQEIFALGVNNLVGFLHWQFAQRESMFYLSDNFDTEFDAVMQQLKNYCRNIAGKPAEVVDYFKFEKEEKLNHFQRIDQFVATNIDVLTSVGVSMDEVKLKLGQEKAKVFLDQYNQLLNYFTHATDSEDRKELIQIPERTQEYLINFEKILVLEEKVMLGTDISPAELFFQQEQNTHGENTIYLLALQNLSAYMEWQLSSRPAAYHMTNGFKNDFILVLDQLEEYNKYFSANVRDQIKTAKNKWQEYLDQIDEELTPSIQDKELELMTEWKKHSNIVYFRQAVEESDKGLNFESAINLAVEKFEEYVNFSGRYATVLGHTNGHLKDLEKEFNLRINNNISCMKEMQYAEELSLASS